jgi:hypothetical protein
MIFGTWNVRSLCRSGSLNKPGKESAKYKLDSVGEQEVRCFKGSNRKQNAKEIFEQAHTDRYKHNMLSVLQ